MESRRRRPATHSQLPAWNTSPLPRGKLTIMPAPRLASLTAGSPASPNRICATNFASSSDRNRSSSGIFIGSSFRERTPSARSCGFGQTAAYDVVQAVDLIAEGVTLGPEQVTVAEPRLAEGPVLRSIY